VLAEMAQDFAPGEYTALISAVLTVLRKGSGLNKKFFDGRLSHQLSI
jgi:hypothetical protein